MLKLIKVNIMKHDRKYYLDLDVLRILSSIAVVLIHVASQNWYTVNDLKTFTVFNFFDSISRFAVPVFFMISGALFLNSRKKINFKNFFKKHFLKMIFIYVIWCILYYLFDYFFLNSINQINIKGIINSIINNKFVLWFLKVMIYIYLFLPFIKTFTDNSSERQIQYFLIIFFILGICFYQLSNLPMPMSVKNMIINMRINDRLWYLGYFILGWYIYNRDISLTIRKIIYILGLISVITCFLFTNIYFAKTGVKNSCLYEYFSLTTFIYSLSIFVFIKYWIQKHNYEKLNLKAVSKKTLGIYLIHVFVLEFVCKLGLNTLSFNPILATILLTFVVYIVSYFITFIMLKIPFVKEIV